MFCAAACRATTKIRAVKVTRINSDLQSRAYVRVPGGGYGLRLNRPGETLETSRTISFPVSRGAAIGTSRDGIPYENKARSSIRNVYAVAKETSSAESHPGASQVRKDILESGKCGGVVVSQLSIHARPLIRRQRY